MGWGSRVLAGAGLVLALGCAVETGPQAQGGVLDLTAWDWHRGNVTLEGQWLADGSPRKVPDTWKGAGAAQYTLDLVLPPGSPPLALRWSTASTAFTLWADGVELASVGTASVDPAATRAEYAPGSARLPGGRISHLEVLVSNRDYRVGGLWRAPILGPVRQVEADQWRDQAAALAVAAALATAGLAFVALFLRRPQARPFLWAGLFALAGALRALVTGEYVLVKIVPGLPFPSLISLEYLSFILPLPLAALFFFDHLPKMAGRVLQGILVWPFLAYAVAAALLPLDLLTRTLTWYYAVSAGAVALLGGLVVVRTWKVPGERLLLVGTLVLGGAGLADTVTAFLLSRSGSLLPWGIVSVVALQAGVLAQAVLRSYERTTALLAEKELLVKEVHHRVKNSLQVVASLVSLQARRIQDPAQKEVFQALRRRITAIALVHEKLHGRSLEDRVDLGTYLEGLLRLQYPADGLDAGRILWSWKGPAVEAEVDACTDAGLVMTELVANARKHGLVRGEPAPVEVEVTATDTHLVLEIRDQGPGFGPDFRPDGAPGLGFRLVLALLERQGGTLEWDLGQGARIRAVVKRPV